MPVRLQRLHCNGLRVSGRIPGGSWTALRARRRMVSRGRWRRVNGKAPSRAPKRGEARRCCARASCFEKRSGAAAPRGVRIRASIAMDGSRREGPPRQRRRASFARDDAARSGPRQRPPCVRPVRQRNPTDATPAIDSTISRLPGRPDPRLQLPSRERRPLSARGWRHAGWPATQAGARTPCSGTSAFQRPSLRRAERSRTRALARS